MTKNLCGELQMIKEKGVVVKGHTEPIFVEKDPQPATHGEMNWMVLSYQN